MTATSSSPKDLCMKGNIYTRERCCGRPMKHDERRSGCFCECGQRASRRFYVIFGRSIRKEFLEYSDAARFLTGLRFKHDEQTLDPRDYRHDNPLSFATLAHGYLDEKRHLKSYRVVRRAMGLCVEEWGDRNVKAVLTNDIKKWVRGLTVSDKTKANYCAILSNFYSRYLVEEGVLRRDQVPEMPKVDYELGYRRITTWEEQDAILEEIQRISSINPKIYFAVDLLRTYTTLRPGDLLRLTEADVGDVLVLWNPTKSRNKRKAVRLLPEHSDTVASIKSTYPALPHVKFFRHHGKVRGQEYGSPWGKNYLYRWWTKACQNIGVHGLDLYGGTRHTTVSELARVEGTHAAREASGHETNKAFDRYCQVQDERALMMAQVVRRRQVVKIK